MKKTFVQKIMVTMFVCTMLVGLIALSFSSFSQTQAAPEKGEKDTSNHNVDNFYDDMTISLTSNTKKGLQFSPTKFAVSASNVSHTVIWQNDTKYGQTIICKPGTLSSSKLLPGKQEKMSFPGPGSYACTVLGYENVNITVTVEQYSPSDTSFFFSELISTKKGIVFEKNALKLEADNTSFQLANSTSKKLFITSNSKEIKPLTLLPGDKPMVSLTKAGIYTFTVEGSPKASLTVVVP